MAKNKHEKDQTFTSLPLEMTVSQAINLLVGQGKLPTNFADAEKFAAGRQVMERFVSEHPKEFLLALAAVTKGRVSDELLWSTEPQEVKRRCAFIQDKGTVKVEAGSSITFVDQTTGSQRGDKLLKQLLAK